MRHYNDLLEIVNSKQPCPKCNGEKPQIKVCDYCKRSGFEQINLSGLWHRDNPTAGFLVCGGPSINKLPYHKLKERGVVSLGVNNIAAHVPVSAWCFSDPHVKFHHALFFDPAIMTFAPTPKLNKRIRIKQADGTFRELKKKVKDCPNTFGFNRKTFLYPEQFLTTEYAHWGYGGKQPESERPYTCLSTMLLGIRLMCYLGCQRIYMLGVDFWRDKEQQYAFGQKANASNNRYLHEDDMLKKIKPYLEEKDIKIFNCNPESKCTAFDYVSFDDAFKICRNDVPEDIDLSNWYEKAN
jgi:hypothetical protein